MKALILAGGIGKRLKPITDYVPKSLIPINNIPILLWQIRYFMKFGVKEFVICTGYKSEQIINYLDTKKNLGVKIMYSIEKTSMGTGGAIRHARHFIDGKSFFVMNGDIITDLDPTQLKSKLNSIALVPLRTAFGVVNLMKDRITRFEEKPKISDYWINAGIYHLSKEIIQHLPKKGTIENTVFPILATKGCLRAIKYTNTFWYSIDSHKDLEECKKSMNSRHYKNFIFKKK